MGEDTAAQHALLVTQITDGKWGKKKKQKKNSACSVLVKIVQGLGQQKPKSEWSNIRHIGSYRISEGN